MPDPATLLLFAATALLFAASPGPNFVFVLTRSVSHGRAEGLMSVLGIGTGALVHTLAAVLGLSALPEDGPGIALATRQGIVKRVAPEWPAKGEAVEVVALRPGDEVVGAVELVPV